MNKPSPKRSVRCSHCGRFMFNVVVTAANPAPGELAQIRDLKCAHCGRDALVIVGVVDKDNRSEGLKIEEQIRKTLKEEDDV